MNLVSSESVPAFSFAKHPKFGPPYFSYLLRLADDHLILGHRLSEWCGHAPSLEEDLALTNIALDLLGQARILYTHAGAVEGAGRCEDQLAYLRLEHEYGNALLLEQPNGDFAHTIVRQYFYSAMMHPFWQASCMASDTEFAAIAAKAEKEVAYHLRHASEWMIRLGAGTVESHQRMTAALANLTGYTAELFEMDEIATIMLAAGISPDLSCIQKKWQEQLDWVLDQAGLFLPNKSWQQNGGRHGAHTEHLGHILCELQFMQRTYPGLTW